MDSKEEMFLIIKHLLHHPQLNLNVEIIRNGAKNPQKVLLNSYAIFTCNILDEKSVELFKLIIHSQFKETSYLENVKLVCYLFKEQIMSLGSIAVFLIKYYRRSENICALQHYVQILLDAGFDMQIGDVSPLTLFILNIQRYNNKVEITDTQPEGEVPEPHPASKFIDFLINHGAHVGQQMLPLRYYRDKNLLALREKLFLPDALLAALNTGE
jgi:hypothetical protein